MSRFFSVRVAAVTVAAGCVVALASPVSADETLTPEPAPQATSDAPPAVEEPQPEAPAAEESGPQESGPGARTQSVPEPAAEPELAPTTTRLTLRHGTILAGETSTSDVLVRSAAGPVAGARVTVTAKGTRTRTGSGTTDAKGRVRVGVKGFGTGDYDVTATVEPTDTTAASTSAASTLMSQKDRRVSLMINGGFDRVVRKGENFWMRGKVLRTGGKPDAGRKVTLYRVLSNGKRTKVATLRTNSYGGFTYAVPRRSTSTYRAVVSSARFSTTVQAKVTSGSRTLDQRERALSFLLGKRKGSAGIRTGGGASWIVYEKGTLVKSGSRTWVVLGRVQTEMNRLGGPAGSLRAPTGDVRCRLPESACMQQFERGSVYVNSKAKKKVTSAVVPASAPRGAGDLLAVARSQVGYREPAPRKSKYSKWIKRTGPNDPWCGFFQSWLAHAAGKPGAVPKATSFPALLKADRARKRTSGTPRVGRLAYVEYLWRGTPSHVGIVHKVSSSHVWLVEGNVSAGGRQKHPRGIHVVKRPRSQIGFYSDPRY